METTSHRRVCSVRWFHAFPAFVVERSVRECAARARLRVGGELVLEGGVRAFTGDWLLADECAGICVDAQRRAANGREGEEKVFPERIDQGYRDFAALHAGDSGADQSGRAEADYELFREVSPAVTPERPRGPRASLARLWRDRLRPKS